LTKSSGPKNQPKTWSNTCLNVITTFILLGFRRFKFNDTGSDIDRKQDMDILDFLLATNLLARITYDKKLRRTFFFSYFSVMFELCDDDDDGCMRPAEILQMLQRVERIFARECSRVELQSQILINQIADKKAEQNFHFIMGMIKHQNYKKQQEQAKKEHSQKEIKPDPKQPAAAAQETLKFIPVDFDEDNLITYREFMSAIKGLKNSLYKSILPRTLAFEDVLGVIKKEEDFKISDVQVDDFAMFRYELNSIFRKHHFLDEQNSELFGGKHPLSKVQGQQLKDLPAERKKEVVDIFRPPGIIKPVETTVGYKSNIDERILYTVPTVKLYRRSKPEENGGRFERGSNLGMANSLNQDRGNY